MAKPAFLTLEIYQLAESFSNRVWEVVGAWPRFPQITLGAQLVCSADSVPSNIAEGYGRGSRKDQAHFLRIARGSLNESISLLRRCCQRRLIDTKTARTIATITDELGPRLNADLRTVSRTSVAGTASGDA